MTREPAIARPASRLLTAVLAAAAVVAPAAVAPAAGATAAPPRTHLIVRTVGAVPGRGVLARSSGVAVSEVRALGPHLAAVTAAGPTAAAAAALKGSPLVTAASPDRRVSLAGATAPVHPADAAFDREWDLWDRTSLQRAGGYGVDAPRAWSTTLGSPGVVVAIIDTGITDHPDLAGASVLPGYDFVSEADGVITGDGDGWDADPTDPGDACPQTGEDSSWHGTFVAGEIAAQHDSFGTAGAAPGVSIEPVRVLGGCGGTESDTVAAIEWASGGTVDGVPANEHPANVLSMSLGSAEGVCPPALQTAIDDATGRGATVVAAAGNDGGRVAAVSPGNCRGVITVAATTRSGALAAYSNRGSAALSPTIAAPGGDDDDPIIGDGWSATGSSAGDGRAQLIDAEGTSMAAPRVAAAAALLLSVSPGLTPDQVRQRIVATATPFPASSGCTPVRCGPGIVNLGDLIGAPRRFVLSTSIAVRGSLRLGALLTASGGRWRPAATVLRYRWLRDGVPIPHRSKATMRVTKADLGHRISVQVTAARAGTTTTVAVSAGRRIPR